MTRLCSGILLVLAAGTVAPGQEAGKKKKNNEIVFEEGKLVSVSETKVVVDVKKPEDGKGKSGKQSRNIKPDTRITLEGRDVKAKDLVPGLDIRMQVKGKDIIFLEAKCPK